MECGGLLWCMRPMPGSSGGLHAVMRTSHSVADACVELMIVTCVGRAGGCCGCHGPSSAFQRRICIFAIEPRRLGRGGCASGSWPSRMWLRRDRICTFSYFNDRVRHINSHDSYTRTTRRASLARPLGSSRLGPLALQCTATGAVAAQSRTHSRAGARTQTRSPHRLLARLSARVRMAPQSRHGCGTPAGIFSVQLVNTFSRMVR